TLIFEDNIGFYFARERVLERLTLASTFLPEGVVPYLAPDTTAVGQIFWYTVEGGDMEPGRRWALQEYYIGPEINSVPGVAEVGTVGGMPLEYQIDVDPNALRAYNITLGELYESVARSNSAVGGRVVQKNNAEYLIRGVGWLGTLKDGGNVEKQVLKDIEDTVITAREGIPIYVKNLAKVQVGPRFRRSVFIKGGSEVVGAAVMMRYGENPLAVTQRIKRKIQELQPALPPGVHIVPAYDRTRLIHGAIHNVTEVMGHEMLIAAVAILLILMHIRSVFVICITLPLSVLFSFLMLWVLRVLHIIDIQANIMSLAGITISIGILVDQAIVMVENATHHLKEHFGDKPVRGDTTEIIVRACRTVGRPIFFSVLIILISFIPVFAMSGREGKYFHPMAFTKSLAMVGVALISVTVVPALLPTFLRGRIRGEEENWIVRGFIHIYKPMLTWALPRRNLVMWLFAVLLILAVGMFPLQAVLGRGTDEGAWRDCFFVTLALVTFLTVIFIRGWHWQMLSFVTLVLIGLTAYRLPRIGVEFMPPLVELSDLYMPVTTPRASVTEAADDLKVQDQLLRQFPEVESVVNKAGRANTPTDNAPLEMVETFVNFRPKELWPRRAMAYEDAERQARRILGVLEERGYVRRADADERDALLKDATMAALMQFDEALRDLALQRYREFEKELAPVLTRFAVEDTLSRFRAADLLRWPDDVDEPAETNKLVAELVPSYGNWLSKNPALEDVTKVTQAVAQRLYDRQVLTAAPAKALELRATVPQRIFDTIAESLGTERKTFDGEVLKALEKRRHELWIERIHKVINWELFDRVVEAFTWAALQELGRAAKTGRDLLDNVEHGEMYNRFVEEATKGRNGKDYDKKALGPFAALRQELEKPFAKGLILWQRKPGPKGDLRSEMEDVVQMPGWSPIWTQPIINRINMLSTGVRTRVGVKVFGPDLDTINRVCKEVEQVLMDVRGAQYVVAEQFMG
ncbi:MAG: efflux RND transporter permease subunit, partial [Gemmataceae bacterium]